MALISRMTAEGIARRFVASKFDALRSKHEKLADPLIAEALNVHYTEEGYKAFLALPAIFHQKEKNFHIKLRDKGYYMTVETNQEFTVPVDGYRRHNLSVEKKPDLATKFEAWETENQRLTTERRQLEIDTRAAILAIRTEKNLRERWPEVYEFFSGKKDAKPAGAVVVRTDDIMKRLDAAETPPKENKPTRAEKIATARAAK